MFSSDLSTLLRCPGGKAGAYTLPDSVASIGGNAFESCISLTNVTIPGSVTSVGDYAFNGCTGLTSVAVGYGVTSIGYDAFGQCVSLNAITVDPSNPNYGSVDGVLFSSDLSTLLRCPGGKAGTYTIPDAATSIGDNAFESCASLACVTIPGSVASIGFSAFANCTGLKYAYFRGNAPNFASSPFNPHGIFSGDTATLYYLPGKTGWDTVDAGAPVALWRPVVPGDNCLGVRTNQFGFNINWADGMVVVVEACTNLTSASWIPLQTNTLSGDSLYFSDSQWTQYPGRYYRIVSP